MERQRKRSREKKAETESGRKGEREGFEREERGTEREEVRRRVGRWRGLINVGLATASCHMLLGTCWWETQLTAHPSPPLAPSPPPPHARLAACTETTR